MSDDTQTAATTETSTQPTETAVIKPTDKSFTPEQQEMVERIVKERLARAKTDKVAVRAELLKELGVKDIDDPKALDTVKGKLTAAEKAEEAAKTAEQKQIDQINQLMADLESEKQKSASAETARRADKLNARIETLATGLKAQVPADVVDYLQKHHAEGLTALMGEDGTINDKEAEKLLESVKKARPHWFGITAMGTMSLREGRTQDITTQQQNRGIAATQRAIKRGGF